MTSAFPAMETERTLLRPLSVDDVSERYLSWLDDVDAKRWIVAAAKTKRLSDLRSYVAEKVQRIDVLFLGIFDRSNGVHIGNIKYDPIVPQLQAAVVGVLIGEPAYRGRGLFEEVFIPTANWLHKHRKINDIYLGVDTGNKVAMKAYQKTGFAAVHVTPVEMQALGNVSMSYQLSAA
jgi:RimJ/RimL family protein N-acetyltransferase